MTDHQFLAMIAKRIAATPDWLRKMGYRVVPCRCGWNDCPGWQIVK